MQYRIIYPTFVMSNKICGFNTTNTETSIYKVFGFWINGMTGCGSDHSFTLIGDSCVKAVLIAKRMQFVIV